MTLLDIKCRNTVRHWRTLNVSLSKIIGGKMMEKKLTDILEILMSFEHNFSNLYVSISEIEGQYSSSIKTVSKVLAIEEAKHYVYYKKLIDTLQNNENIQITDEFYEKSNTLLREFKEAIKLPSPANVNDLLKIAITFENSNVELLKCFLEILSTELNEEESDISLILKDILLQEERHSRSLLQYLK
jgi:rubrerythrin